MAIKSVKEEQVAMLVQDELYHDAGFMSSKFIELYQADTLNDIISDYDNLSKNRHTSCQEAYKKYLADSPSLLSELHKYQEHHRKYMRDLRNLYEKFDESYLQFELELNHIIWRTKSPDGNYKPAALISIDDVTLEYDSQDDIDGYIHKYGFANIQQHDRSISGIVNFNYFTRDEWDVREKVKYDISVRLLPLEFMDNHKNICKGYPLVEIIYIEADEDENDEDTTPKTAPVKPVYQLA